MSRTVNFKSIFKAADRLLEMLPPRPWFPEWWQPDEPDKVYPRGSQYCPSCGSPYVKFKLFRTPDGDSRSGAQCYSCHGKFQFEDPKEEEPEKHEHACPKCGSTQIASKGFQGRWENQCHKCGHKWWSWETEADKEAHRGAHRKSDAADRHWLRARDEYPQPEDWEEGPGILPHWMASDHPEHPELAEEPPELPPDEGEDWKREECVRRIINFVLG
jgi:hypothetical protein